MLGALVECATVTDSALIFTEFLPISCAAALNGATAALALPSCLPVLDPPAVSQTEAHEFLSQWLAPPHFTRINGAPVSAEWRF
jgi:hypothetical protein